MLTRPSALGSHAMSSAPEDWRCASRDRGTPPTDGEVAADEPAAAPVGDDGADRCRRRRGSPAAGTSLACVSFTPRPVRGPTWVKVPPRYVRPLGVERDGVDLAVRDVALVERVVARLVGGLRAGARGGHGGVVGRVRGDRDGGRLRAPERRVEGHAHLAVLTGGDDGGRGAQSSASPVRRWNWPGLLPPSVTELIVTGPVPVFRCSTAACAEEPGVDVVRAEREGRRVGGELPGRPGPRRGDDLVGRVASRACTRPPSRRSTPGRTAPARRTVSPAFSVVTPVQSVPCRPGARSARCRRPR